MPTEDFLADFLQTVAEFHDRTIREHGGVPTFRDRGTFELSVARPWMTVFGEQAYKTPFEKAAAIAEAIVRNHPFNDGNHRTALAAAHLVLGLHDLALVASDDELRDTIRQLGGGALSMGEFGAWLERRCVLRPLQPS
ncbi:MAG: type II toxin-antitoxin system death-on-curing family toxin [Terriglobia bacterium]